MSSAAAALAQPGDARHAGDPGEEFVALRAHSMLAELADEELMLAIGRRDVQIRRFWRDDLMADGESLELEGPRIFVLLSGQAAVGLFDPDVLADERAWIAQTPADARRQKIRPQGPVIELSERNLATFGAGDLFNSRAIAADRRRNAFFAVTPVEAIVARPEWIGQLAARYRGLASRLQSAIAAVHNQLGKMTGSSAGIVDFYVRQGLSVSGRLRVLQIDRCIECLQCERACEARYGHRRLSIKDAPRLGRLGFVRTCRTCVDQRCLDPCNFDSIEFDPERGEVVIAEDMCTGCASCATACPYDAIDMVRLDDRDNRRFTARLNKANALAYGRSAPRREAAEQIASKCDHCSTYGDQACISHCPTGALVELSATDLFDEMTLSPFERGSRLPSGPGPRPRRLIRAGFLWFLGLVAFAVAFAEILLRWLAPEYSAQYWLLVVDGLEPAVAKLNVDFLAGSTLSRWLGYSGTALMAAALLYPLRKRVRLLYWISTGGAWFDLHVIGGVLGPLFIVLHSAFHLTNWVSIGFWSFCAVVVSGVVGRYLYTQMHERFSGQSVVSLVHRTQLHQLGAAYPDTLAVADRAVNRYQQWTRIEPASVGFIRAVVWLAVDTWIAPFRRMLRASRLRRTSAPRRVRKQMARHVSRLMRQQRRNGITLRFEGFFKSWLRIHVLFTVVAVVITAAHIVAALTFSM